MSRSMKSCALVVAAVVVAGTMSCWDDRITNPQTSESPEAQGLIVSSPMLLASASGGAVGATRSVLAGTESVAFVSLVPSTVPAGVSATIENRRKGVTRTATVVDGGFDPVGIPASIGDTVNVAVTNAADVVVFRAASAIKSPHRPVVVRTNPPAKKTDIPLNIVMQVVFSAPIDSTTLTTASIQLFRDGTPVAGTAQFRDSNHIIAEYRPNDLLSSNTPYRLLITQEIRDVNHMALETNVDVPFTTGTREVGASRLSFTAQPTNTTAGVAISPVVAVAIQDASGNTVTDATGPVSIELASGTTGALRGTTTVNAVNGVANFEDLSIEQANNYSLVAHYAVSVFRSLQSGPSATFSVVPAAASKLLVVGTGPVDAARQFTVYAHVSDAFGNIVRSATNSVTLSLSSNPGGATLAGTLTVPALLGFAPFENLTIDKPGVGYVLQATSGTLTAGTLQLDVWSRDAFASVSAGGAHTCALTRDGYTYCWGANANGQVGAGTTIDYASPVIVASSMGTVSAGGSHTCALTINKGFYCWGLNDDGQLGDGTKTTRLSPTPVTSYPGGDGVITGGSHTCAYFNTDPWDFGVTTTCWGNNGEGRLGNDNSNVIALAAGGSHTCGNDYGSVPALYCWGSNKNGQLGDGALTQFRQTPFRVAPFFGSGALSAGASHTCANITVGGTGGLFCWGLNDNGQLGDGTTTERSSPAVVSGGPFSSVAAGGSHTCALTSAGAAYCWGANDKGQLGDGTTTMRTSPVPVSGGLTFVALSAGGSHTCGVTVFGTYCWGANGNGQLGNGATTDSAVPVKVSGQ